MSALSFLMDEDFNITAQQKTLIDSLFMGMTDKQAKARAGYSDSMRVSRYVRENPQLQEYANYLQRQEKQKWAVSREQVTQGIMEAIQDAKHLEEPNTQINGWRELGRLHGLYAPEEKKVTLSQEKQERVRQLEEASLDELLDMTGHDVIEGDFEMINNGE